MSQENYSFGVAIKAARLGYRWSARHGGFVRVSDDGDGFFVEFAPASGIPNDKKHGGPYRCWWEGGDMLNLSPVISTIRKVRRAFSLRLDNSGNDTNDALNEEQTRRASWN